jgi:hypothetical protein
MVNAVCSLLNVYSRQRQHFKVENIKRQAPKPFKLSDQTLSMIRSLHIQKDHRIIIAELNHLIR